MLFPNMCAGFVRCCCGVSGEGCFGETLGAPGSLVYVGGALLVYPSCVQGSGYVGVPIAGHAHWAEVGGGIFFVTYGEFTGLHKKMPISFLGSECHLIGIMPHMLASVGQPILHGCYACMVFSAEGHSTKISGKSHVRLFFQFEFFCLIGILVSGFGV